MQMYNRIAGVLMMATYVGITGCRKFVTIPPPEEAVQTTDLFNNNEAAVSAVAGLYDLMITTAYWPMNGGISIFTGLSADELVTTAGDADMNQFGSNALVPANAYLDGYLWGNSYKAIYSCNAILAGLASSKQVQASLADQLRGETLLVRAMHYFYLVNLFGDVPLIVSTDYRENQVAPHSSAASIYKAIKKDLLEAVELLPSVYVSAGRARPNKHAAQAMLARLYLYLDEWDLAEQTASAIINTGDYQLQTDLQYVFLPASTETIWELATRNHYTDEAAIFIPFLSFLPPSYALTSQLLDAFEVPDLRKQVWTGSNTVGSTVYYFPFKYKTAGLTGTPENYIVFRLAEQYLIRAEARARLSILHGVNSATTDLNIIRARAGLAYLDPGNQQDMIRAIANERRLEFFAEWGHRWLDLKRTATATDILGPIKAPAWQPTDTLYPIPSEQIRLNNKLSQNPGY